MRFLPRPAAGRATLGKSSARRCAGVICFAFQSLLMVLLVFAGTTSSASAASTGSSHAPVVQASVHPLDLRVRQMVQATSLAPTVHVLTSLAPTLVEQFPLVPSGLKQVYPHATALVTIVRGDRDNSVADTITVDVQQMPPDITFTIFFIELANKPFGHVEYVADLTTRGDGSGETVFQCIALVAFAMDARNPGTSPEAREGATSGINLEHMGMWFSSLQDAQQVLNDDGLQGTIFDGGSPPLHAGPQAMTDGQSAPVF